MRHRTRRRLWESITQRALALSSLPGGPQAPRSLKVGCKVEEAEPSPESYTSGMGLGGGRHAPFTTVDHITAPPSETGFNHHLKHSRELERTPHLRGRSSVGSNPPSGWRAKTGPEGDSRA